MEQKTYTIEPFDLEKALAGEPYGFRNLDKPVAIIAQANPVLSDGKQLVSQFNDKYGCRLITHWADGRFLEDKESHLDLVMFKPVDGTNLKLRVKARLLYISDVWIICNILTEIGVIDQTKPSAKKHAVWDLMIQAGCDGRHDVQSIGVFDENIAKHIYAELSLRGIPVKIE